MSYMKTTWLHDFLNLYLHENIVQQRIFSIAKFNKIKCKFKESNRHTIQYF